MPLVTFLNLWGSILQASRNTSRRRMSLWRAETPLTAMPPAMHRLAMRTSPSQMTAMLLTLLSSPQ